MDSDASEPIISNFCWVISAKRKATYICENFSGCQFKGPGYLCTKNTSRGKNLQIFEELRLLCVHLYTRTTSSWSYRPRSYPARWTGWCWVWCSRAESPTSICSIIPDDGLAHSKSNARVGIDSSPFPWMKRLLQFPFFWVRKGCRWGKPPAPAACWTRSSSPVSGGGGVTCSMYSFNPEMYATIPWHSRLYSLGSRLVNVNGSVIVKYSLAWTQQRPKAIESFTVCIQVSCRSRMLLRLICKCC